MNSCKPFCIKSLCICSETSFFSYLLLSSFTSHPLSSLIVLLTLNSSDFSNVLILYIFLKWNVHSRKQTQNQLEISLDHIYHYSFPLRVTLFYHNTLLLGFSARAYICISQMALFKSTQKYVKCSLHFKSYLKPTIK